MFSKESRVNGCRPFFAFPGFYPAVPRYVKVVCVPRWTQDRGEVTQQQWTEGGLFVSVGFLHLSADMFHR